MKMTQIVFWMKYVKFILSVMIVFSVCVLFKSFLC